MTLYKIFLFVRIENTSYHTHMKHFGEIVPGYHIPVFNEREVRAAAGILFFFATLSFYNAFLDQDFLFLKIFVVFFLIDFFIRIFVNPRYSPTLILGRIIVSNQKPEYTGAPQKYFAWSLGFGMALCMSALLFVFNISGIVNLIVCSICLLLLFSETSFGICIGCKMYEWFTKEKPQLCPGNVCDIVVKEKIQEVDEKQIGVLILFALLMIALISALFPGIITVNPF
jgi:hypothetical protein